MTWWIWCILGFALLVLETFIPAGFFSFFLGISAILVGLLELIFPSISQESHWYIFVALALVLIALFRKRLLAKKGKGAQFQEILGENIVLEGDIPAGAKGKGELRGTKWKVRNISQEDRKAGESVPVKSVRGFTVEI